MAIHTLVSSLFSSLNNRVSSIRDKRLRVTRWMHLFSSREWYRVAMKTNCYTLFLTGRKSIDSGVSFIYVFSTRRYDREREREREWRNFWDKLWSTAAIPVYSRLIFLLFPLLFFSPFLSFYRFFFFLFSVFFFIENSVMVNIERMRKLISRLHGGKMKYKMGPLRSQLLQLDEKVIITLIVQRGNK